MTTTTKSLFAGKTIVSLLSVLFLLLIGCSDMPTQSGNGGFGGGIGSGGNGGNGGGGLGGGGNTGNVTFTVELVQDQQGSYFFGCKPSVDVKLTSVKVTQQQANVNENLNNPNPNEVFKAGELIYLSIDAQYLQQGQAWNFVFSGTTVSGNQNFTANANCNIP